MPEEIEFRKFRCHVHSAPGMWAFYEGHVDVYAQQEEDVFPRAVKELGRTAFRDRPHESDWKLDKIERLD